MLNENQRASIEECIQLLQEPSEQLKAVNRLIGICMALRMERRPTARTAVRSLLEEALERPLIELLPRVIPLVRRKLVFVLGEVGGRWQFELEPEAVQALARRAREDSNVDVRAAAVDALGKLGGPSAVDALKQVAEKDLVSTVRARALFSWAYLAPPEYRVYGITSIDEFLEQIARLGDYDTSTVARELQRKRRLGL